MFSNLMQGSILHGVDTTGEPTPFTAIVERVTPERPTYKPNGNYGQFIDVRVTIEASVNGEHREFRNVPANNSIADFGKNGAILADNKDALNAYVDSIINTSQKVVDSYEENKLRVSQFSRVREQLNPSYGGASESVQELRDEVSSLKGQLAEAIALLKEKQTNKQ